MGSNPPLRRPFSGTIHLDQKPGAKIEWRLTWDCGICCNPSKGRVDFEDGWLIKSSFITEGWNEVLSANQDQIPTKKYICKGKFDNKHFFFCFPWFLIFVWTFQVICFQRLIRFKSSSTVRRSSSDDEPRSSQRSHFPAISSDEENRHQRRHKTRWIEINRLLLN